MTALIASRTDTFPNSSRVRTSSDLSRQRERFDSSSTIQQAKQGYRRSWASDSSTNRPRSTSSPGLGKEVDPVQTEQEQLHQGPYIHGHRPGPQSRSASSSSVNLANRRPLEATFTPNSQSTSMATSRGWETAPSRSQVQTQISKGKFGQEPDLDVKGKDVGQLPPQQHSFNHFSVPQHQWTTVPQRTPSATSVTQAFSYNQFPQFQLPPQIQQLSPAQQQAYIRAVMTQQYQDTQKGLAAWQGAYQDMLVASQGGTKGYPIGQHPAQSQHGNEMEQLLPQVSQTQPRSVSAASSTSSMSTSGQGPGYHPYRRQPSKQNVANHRNRESSAGSSTTGNYPEADEQFRQGPARPSVDRRGSSASLDGGVRAKIGSSSRKPVPAEPVVRRDEPRVNVPDSVDLNPSSAPRRNMHRKQNSSTSSVGEVIEPTLRSTPMGSDGLNPTAREWRPSPLAQSPSLPSVEKQQAVRSVSEGTAKEEKKEKSGLRGKLQKAMKRDTDSKTSTPTKPTVTTSVSAPTLHHPQDSLGSNSNTTRSSSPPMTPPQPQQAPAGLGYRRPSNSSFAPSLIEPLDGRGGKAKRSLFNMRNPSMDNISISSTVSSASMMIRRMGALGKLARRNSLAGISKIFKDKDSEDGKIVEEPTEKKKKEKRFRFGGSKGQPATSSTSHAVVEAEDRVLDGLSPAAHLARQHTLRSNKDDPNLERSLPATPTGASGGQGSADPYDSDDISFEGEDLTARMENTHLDDETRESHEMSRDWQENGLYWGQGYVDRHAIPSRGILKSISSYSPDTPLQTPNAPWTRARSNSTEVSAQYPEPGPLARLSVHHEIDGKHKTNDAVDPLSPSYDPFGTQESKASERPNLYANPSLNSSAPLLSNNFGQGRNQRATTSPLPRKRLEWAPECAIYHTFHATEYDRRSEVATCNRLTPALAQEIKDELNGFKMEEMAVHPSSRIHTHFFV